MNPATQQTAANAPQVVVRAGKTFLCSACGTLVQIPDDVVSQLGIAVDHSVQDQPERESPAQETSTQAESGPKEPAANREPTTVVAVPDSPPARTPQKHRPPRPRRPIHARPERFTGQLIDGLRVPSAHELDRALAWVSFHLKVLDRQGSEVKRLQKLLKARSTHVVSPQRSHADAKMAPVEHRAEPLAYAEREHPQADLAVAPDLEDQTQRGPPSRRGPP
ncbi:hypothetical protein [Bremerella sp. P1]|uniref:hypothetical protein n=1 Tax=Bremerella sp. P1 TaxID=3026424 RepID=UPI00236895CD|nr:hypothetical protein [Bremerella sp. P1]WDI42906.1 hypothetical protein PSR63_02970 [Bremerella sp. P1]